MDVARTTYGAIAAIPLIALFTLAYEALDQVAPDAARARALHIAVVAVAGAVMAVGALLARGRPLALVGGALGAAFGALLWLVATNYSRNECYDGFWTDRCETSGSMLPWLLVLPIAVAVVALILGLALGSERGAFIMVGHGLFQGASFLVASTILLSTLNQEAERARISNDPVVHDTPGLALAILMVTLLLVARLRRR